MKVTFSKEDKTYKADLSLGVDLSIGITENSPNCFHAPRPILTPYKSGDFIGSTAQGSPVNFYNVSFNPHGNGTHTECLGHVDESFKKIHTIDIPPILIAQVVTLAPRKINNDMVVTKEQFIDKIDTDVEAVLIRTTPNGAEKRTKDYSDKNPAYFEPEAMSYLKDRGIIHLLVDLPSIDKESDGGAVQGHKNFWNLEDAPRQQATITELIYVPDEVKDGIYLLNLQLSNFDLDCAPSRPIIFPLVE